MSCTTIAGVPTSKPGLTPADYEFLREWFLTIHTAPPKGLSYPIVCWAQAPIESAFTRRIMSNYIAANVAPGVHAYAFTTDAACHAYIKLTKHMMYPGWPAHVSPVVATGATGAADPAPAPAAPAPAATPDYLSITRELVGVSR